MADFVAAFEPAKELAYLPDVAALEWACHSAYFADDAAALDLGKLAQIPSEQYPDLILHTHPACHVVTFHATQLLPSGMPTNPVRPATFTSIWIAGSCNALVSRKEDVVLGQRIADCDAAWLRKHTSRNPVGSGY